MFYQSGKFLQWNTIMLLIGIKFLLIKMLSERDSLVKIY